MNYMDICTEMDDRGGYMSNAVGMCQRELLAVQQKRKSRSDLFLTGSATYAAFQRGEDLGQRFDPSRAEPAALIWTHDIKTGRKCPPFPVAVDWSGGVVRQGDGDVFGLLVDVRHCLFRYTSDGQWRPCPGPTGARLPLIPMKVAEDFDRFTTTKPKPNGKGEARIGQAWYREKVIEIWNGRCAVTECDQVELLRASHIVSWSTATGKERLDPENGLLLAAHIDAAFDRGLISFAADGAILFSPRLGAKSQATLGLHARMRLRELPPSTAAYLARHRKHYGFDTAH